jgi:hypothetical protein
MLASSAVDDGFDTDDGRQVMTITHITLWVRWSNKNIYPAINTFAAQNKGIQINFCFIRLEYE